MNVKPDAEHLVNAEVGEYGLVRVNLPRKFPLGVEELPPRNWSVISALPTFRAIYEVTSFSS